MGVSQYVVDISMKFHLLHKLILSVKLLNKQKITQWKYDSLTSMYILLSEKFT